MSTRYAVLGLLLFTCFQSATVSAQDKMAYVVISNEEGMHAAWSADMPLPEGWRATDVRGSLSRCTKSIKKVWTDMRPLSIQKEFDKNAPYMVVINHEEQYAIWPLRKDVPRGWKSADVTGTYGACLDYIEEVWTDMRPLSLRKRLGRTD